MTPGEVKTMIAAVGVPSAYYQFADATAQDTPFICFFFSESSDLAADNKNYARIEQLNIELYTDTKDFELEAAIEEILTEHELVFDREETYIDSEHMHETIYTTNVLLEV